jgi:hypothetical protein
MKKQNALLALFICTGLFACTVLCMSNRNARRAIRDKQRNENRQRAIEQGFDTPALREHWKQRDAARQERQANSRLFGRGRGFGRGRRNCPFNQR